MDKVLELLKSLMGSFANFSSFSGGAGTGFSWLFGALGTVAISLYGLSLGRTRAVISLLSVYVAFTFNILFPYFSNIEEIVSGNIADHWIRIGVFSAVYILVFIVFNISFIRKKLSSGEFSLFGVVLISLCQLGFIISIIFSYLPADLSAGWLGRFHDYFGTQLALFIWAITPLPALFFLRGK